MELWAIGLILFSALLHGVWNYLAKNSIDKYVFSWWMKLFEFLIYMPVGVYLLSIAVIPTVGWYLAMVSGAVHTAYWFFLSASYTHGDLSIVYPIGRSSPIIVTLLAVLFFGESLSYVGILGILTVMMGVYLLSVDSLEPKRFLSPLTLIRKPGVIYALLTALSVTAYTLVDKSGSQYLNPILYVWTEKWISIIPFTFLAATSKKAAVPREWEKNKLPIVAAGLLSPLSYAMIVYVMQSVQVSYIVSVRQVSVVFGVILGGTLLKEKNLKIRLFSSILIFAGLFLIGYQ